MGEVAAPAFTNKIIIRAFFDQIPTPDGNINLAIIQSQFEGLLVIPNCRAKNGLSLDNKTSPRPSIVSIILGGRLNREEIQAAKIFNKPVVREEEKQEVEAGGEEKTSFSQECYQSFKRSRQEQIPSIYIKLDWIWDIMRL